MRVFESSTASRFPTFPCLSSSSSSTASLFPCLAEEARARLGEGVGEVCVPCLSSSSSSTASLFPCLAEEARARLGEEVGEVCVPCECSDSPASERGRLFRIRWLEFSFAGTDGWACGRAQLEQSHTSAAASACRERQGL